MKRFSRLYIIGFLWTSLSLSAQENILTSRVLREPVQKVSEVNDANSVTTIEYYDTAGRLIQTIRKGFGPNGEDLADYIQFDEAGRIAKEYLLLPEIMESLYLSLTLNRAPRHGLVRICMKFLRKVG